MAKGSEGMVQRITGPVVDILFENPDLPDIFHESALLDRFHGFIKGWNIPKMKESLKLSFSITLPAFQALSGPPYWTAQI